MRVDGKFVDKDGNKAEGQFVSTPMLDYVLLLTDLRPCCSCSGDRMA